LVVGMCALDHDSHLEMLAELAALLGDSDAVNIMLNAGDTEQIRELF
jgi:mannitol/fructose-specific phosphotransferase system IIA component (Ntr-type)